MVCSRRLALDVSISTGRFRHIALDMLPSRYCPRYIALEVCQRTRKKQETSVESKRDRGEGEDGDSKNVSLEKPSCRKTFPSSQLALKEIPVIKRGLEEVVMKGVSKVLKGEM